MHLVTHKYMVSGLKNHFTGLFVVTYCLCEFAGQGEDVF